MPPSFFLPQFAWPEWGRTLGRTGRSNFHSVEGLGTFRMSLLSTTISPAETKRPTICPHYCNDCGLQHSRPRRGSCTHLTSQRLLSRWHFRNEQTPTVAATGDCDKLYSTGAETCRRMLSWSKAKSALHKRRSSQERARTFRLAGPHSLGRSFHFQQGANIRGYTEKVASVSHRPLQIGSRSL